VLAQPRPEEERPYDQHQYIGMDVHTESISMAVRNSVGKVVMESVIRRRKASMILQFIEGLARRFARHVFLRKEPQLPGWYDLLKPHVDTIGGVQSPPECLVEGVATSSSDIPMHDVGHCLLPTFNKAFGGDCTPPIVATCGFSRSSARQLRFLPQT